MGLSTAFQILLSIAAVSMTVLVVGSIITRSLRQPLERIRCIQWTLAALMFALVVRQAHLLPEWSLNVLPAEAATADVPLIHIPDGDLEVVAATEVQPAKETAPLLTKSSDEVAAAPATLTVAPTNPAPATTSAWKLLEYVALFVVGVGAMWSLISLAIGRWRLSQLVRNSCPAEESLLSDWKDWSTAKSHGTRVYISDSVDVPMTFGIRKPIILLPTRIAGGDPQSTEYCLSHEWAHIKSRDVATWLAIQLTQPLLWFQPLFWYLRRELRTAQDQLADDFASHGQTDRSDYAELLMGLALSSGMSDGALALTMADRRSSLYRRIELLLADKFKLATTVRRRVVFGTVGCLTLFAIGLGMLRLQPAVAETPATPAADKPAADLKLTGKELAKQDKKKEEPKQEDAVELSYSGRVLDKETGKPVEGATVVVRRAILKSYDRRTIEETSHPTDAKGEYHFKIPPEQTAERSLYIELDVEHPDYAWKKGFGYALSMIRKNEKLGEKPFFSKVELSPADPITGRVVDPDGNPVPNTRMLSYSKSGGKDDFSDYGSFMKTSTDKDGKFRLQMVKGGPSVFWIVPDDFSPVQIVSGTKRGDWGDITVKPGISTTGKVVSATGEPVAGVWVNMEDRDAGKEIQMPVSSSMERSGKTAADGTFELGPMKAGNYRINVSGWRSELTLKQRHFRKPIEVDHVFVAKNIELGEEDAERPFTVQAKPHIEFHGQIVDSKGKPRSGHQIDVFGQFGGTWYHESLKPDKSGKIVGKLPHGLAKAKLSAMSNEHGSIQIRLEKDGPLHGPRDLDLGTLEDDVTGVEIIRYTAPIVQVKPVDEEGNVVKEDIKISGVYADGKDETMMPVGGMATNMFFEKQDDGRHRSSQMIPNREVKFTADAKGYKAASETLTLPEGEKKELVLVLKRAEPGDEEEEGSGDDDNSDF